MFVRKGDRIIRTGCGNIFRQQAGPLPDVTSDEQLQRLSRLDIRADDLSGQDSVLIVQSDVPAKHVPLSQRAAGSQDGSKCTLRAPGGAHA